MKRLRFESGLTLVEMLIVIGIIALLASISIGLATRIESQGRERLTRATIALLNSALEQFADYKYRYPNQNYQVFAFPLDCTEFPDPCAFNPDIMRPTIMDAMSEPQLSRGATVVPPAAPAMHSPEYSGCEGMYLFLSQAPECRRLLDKIDKTLVTNRDMNKQPLEMVMQVDAGGVMQSARTYPLTRVVDAWGTTLHYDYYDEIALNGQFPVYKDALSTQRMNWVVGSKKTFPVITSAGADRIFGTIDDIRVEQKR